MIPAVILAGNIIGLGVMRSLGRMGVPVVSIYHDRSDMEYVSRYVVERIYAPHPEKEEKEYIELLKAYGARSGRAILIPADDATLLIVSRNKRSLEEHYIVAATDFAITDNFIDKKKTYAIAESIGIPVPRTFVPAGESELEMFGELTGYPCLVKPCQSHLYFEKFRKKITRADNFPQMLYAYKEARDAGLEVMLQEYIPGDDTRSVNYNSYFWDGRPIVEFTAEKVRISPPGFGVPSAVISKEIPEVLDPGRKILQALGFYGYSCTEFKRDARDGVYKLMEVNGRHNRSTLLAVHCGINFPLLQYRHLVFGERPLAGGYRKNVYWIDEFKDLEHGFKYAGKLRYPLRFFLKPYLSEHVFAGFDAKDIRPFLKRMTDLIRKFMPEIRKSKEDGRWRVQRGNKILLGK